jgi:hypothetical protein
MKDTAKRITLYILAHARNVTKTKLSKLLFLIDDLYRSQTGDYLTEFIYIKYFNGPYPRGFEDFLNDLSTQELIHFREHETDIGTRYYTVELGSKVQKTDLDSVEQTFVDTVLEQYSTLPTSDIVENIMEFNIVKNRKFAEYI